MQAVAKVSHGEGGVALIEAPEPVVVPGHVLIEVAAAGICGTDLHIYHDEYPYDPPVVLGHELAGVVARVGEDVTSCSPGDRVT
ncbi:MAG: alcohol dehydrogenase catalytic domain-containing protein, partial [Chloroflexi bacterium]|nr:alcohol dehydrogenase catalytic domain-containing protein [Chloroflexota bacterium]